MKKFITTLTALTILAGCTERDMVRSFGGSETIELAECERLVTEAGVTWGSKQNSANIWFTTVKDCSKPPKEYTYRRSTAFGVFEGKLIIKEK